MFYNSSNSIVQLVLGKMLDHRKASETMLLYKKGDPLDIKNYRPIALADTLTKRYTGLLANCIGSFAEKYEILSSI